MQNASRLRERLKAFGFSDPAVDAAWPKWWSDEADQSLSAKADLRFSLARKLGLDPKSLLDDDEAPLFVWRDAARFKRLRGESDTEKAAIVSFGNALGGVLLSAAEPMARGLVDALTLRAAILKSQDFVRLIDILSACWSLGVPVIHLRVFPWPQKRMAAMSVRRNGRYAILLSKDSLYPAHIAFYLAHELAHVTLGHLNHEAAIIDLEDGELTGKDVDPEEADADTFALQLLTGEERPVVLPSIKGNPTARGLANAALAASKSLRIEPGTLALCFGYSTGKWQTANAAMRHIYAEPKPVWREVNAVAWKHLLPEMITDDMGPYLDAVLGQDEHGAVRSG